MKSLPFLVSMFCASVAFAEPPRAPSTQPAPSVAELVNKHLLAPLKKAESRRSRFSRAAPVVMQRRLRVLDTVALTDGRGKAFFRFAIDERRPWDASDVWEVDSVIGCAYPDDREVFVRQGERFLPARSLLGESTEAKTEVCRAVPQDGSPIASLAK